MNNFQVEIIAAIRKESTGMATSCIILTWILSPATWDTLIGTNLRDLPLYLKNGASKK
jgi:hypothetical protein